MPGDDTTTDAPEKPKRIRPKKTKRQKAAAAEASARYREKLKGAGVPSPAEIDTTLAAALVKGMHTRNGLHLSSGSLPALLDRIYRFTGWDRESKAVRKAVEHRIAALRLRQRAERLPGAGDKPRAMAEPG